MPRRLWAILAVAFGVSLSVIDSAIANVALPTIGLELGISAADSIWIVNAYQLAIMVSLLSFSALGDVVGYRKVYIGGLMLFTVASVGCALSTSLPTLVLARVMQGSAPLPSHRSTPRLSASSTPRRNWDAAWESAPRSSPCHRSPGLRWLRASSPSLSGRGSSP